jgi:hypothetical protein
LVAIDEVNSLILSNDFLNISCYFFIIHIIELYLIELYFLVHQVSTAMTYLIEINPTVRR